MATIPDQLQEYIHEGNINYQMSRFKDAAGTFLRIADSCKQNNMILDSIYFTYRTAVANEKDNNTKSNIKILSDLGLYLLKKSTQMAGELIPLTDDLKDKLSLMMRTELILNHLLMIDEQDAVRKSIISLCIQLIEESIFEEALGFIDILLKYNVDESIRNKYLKRTIEIYKKIADDYQYPGHPNNEKDNLIKTIDFKLHYYSKAENIAKLEKYKVLLKNISDTIKSLNNQLEVANNNNNNNK